MIKSNFHTHTAFCDGKNTAEELVIAAINKGFTALGFSGHSYFEPDKDITMSLENQKKYIATVNELKKKYEGVIEIFCGIEQDILSEKTQFEYDYMIGSVHTIEKNGDLIGVDWSAENTAVAVEKYYGGDFDLFAEEYFEYVGNVLDVTGADIIGHIDLVSKFSEQNGYGESERYLKAAERAVKKLVKHKKPFEINTGAMARGTRSVPYPSKAILRMIFENGGKIVFSSDCHDADYLDYGFDEAVCLAKECGFSEHGIWTEHGFEYFSI